MRNRTKVMRGENGFHGVSSYWAMELNGHKAKRKGTDVKPDNKLYKANAKKDP